MEGRYNRRHYIGPGRRPIETQELEQLIESARENMPQLVMPILVAGYSGLRRMEIAQLHTNDFHGSWIHIVSGKGNVSRRTVAPAIVQDELMKMKRAGKTGAITKLCYGTLGIYFRRLVKRTGLTDDLSFHCLRHHFAMRLIRANVPLNEVADLMGHRWITSTAVYLHIGDDLQQRALDAMNGTPPPVLQRDCRFRIVGD